ncbi:MAG: CDP-alcohol phosphatidyltransferase family protein [Lentisphaeria bacterium]|nr:CDP-alcohol phosphatidyltransferase family protein [Lentisphaeria bacterium]
MKLKKAYRAIPTALTLGNTLCGFGAILNTLKAYEADADVPAILVRSGWLIVCAMIFDMLDGWTARKLNASSDHGMHMDSLADMVTFGVAPAVMVSVLAHKETVNFGFPHQFVWICCAIYVGCVALRLATYNVMTLNKEEQETVDQSEDAFSGLPSPGAAAAVSSLIFLYNSTTIDLEFYKFHFSKETIAKILPFYAAILGFIMVSKVPYMHFGKWLGSKKNNKLKMFIVIIFFMAFAKKSVLMSALVINVYVIWGLIKYFLLKIKSKI